MDKWEIVQNQRVIVMPTFLVVTVEVEVSQGVYGSGRSCMYRLKNVGDKTQPLGTPFVLSSE